MRVDAVFWRGLRQDFESLQNNEFSLIWNSSPQAGLIGNTIGESHWAWWRYPDESLKTRLSAIALRGARALGYDSEDAWYDELRRSEFVRFNTMGSSQQKRPDGGTVDSEFGPINDVVKESITLCYKLEANADSAEARKTISLPSWQDVRAEFLRGAAEYPDLTAQWDARQKQWTFRSGSPEAERLFKETARIAIGLSGEPGVAGPFWFVLLELMRKERRGFRRIPQLRSWGGGQFFETGVLPADAVMTENGYIKHVFNEAADFCADLGAQTQMRGPESFRQHDSSQGKAPAASAFLPDLNPEARERIERVLKDAESYVNGALNRADHETTAMLRYFDGLAWEYMVTRPATDFEALANAICEKTKGAFDGSPEILDDRKTYWITEARERETNGIIGEKIPVGIEPIHASVFQDLQVQFRALPGAGPDLQAHFNDGGQRRILPGPKDPAQYDLVRQQFERLARRAMAALGFKFVDPARAVIYWLDLLRQENPRLKNWLVSRLCFECAEFCAELETRALETARGPQAVVDGNRAPFLAEAEKSPRETPKLDVDRIRQWMEGEGYDNNELAKTLKLSSRAVSSLRNNGNYHGDDAVTRLANLMKIDVDDLYLP